MELLTTLATVPAIVALVTLIKNTTNLRTTYLPLLAVVFGIALSLYDFFALPGATGTAWQAAGTGLILGLTASGLYDTAKAVGAKAPGTVVYEDPSTRPEDRS
jgi:membrane associated rhomboid family serine protease